MVHNNEDLEFHVTNISLNQQESTDVGDIVHI